MVGISNVPKVKWTSNLRAKRSGIALRLGMGFAVVVLLAATSNLIAEHAVGLIAQAWKPTHHPSVIVVKQSASLIAPAIERVARLPSTQEIASGVSALERAAMDISRHADPARPLLNAAASQLALSQQKFSRSAAEIADRSGLHNVVVSVTEVRSRATQLVSAADRFHAASADYAAKLQVITAQLSAPEATASSLSRAAKKQLALLSGHVELLRSVAVELALADTAITGTESAGRLEADIQQDLFGEHEILQRACGEVWIGRVSSALAGARAARAAMALQRQLVIAARTQLRQAVAAAERRISQWEVSRAQAMAVVADESRLSQEALLAQAAGTAAAREVEQTALRETQAMAVRDQAVRLKRLAAIVTAGMLVLSLVISFVTVQAVVRPVRRLIRATARVAAGDTNVTVMRGGAQELDALAAAFNAMAGEVDQARAVRSRYSHDLELLVKERTHELQHQATHDPLTGLPNRRQLLERLTAQIAHARSSGSLVAIYFIDLDNFKHVNDGTGHGFGDQLLIACAERLERMAQPIGVAARFGGDEFVIVTHGLRSVDAVHEFGEELVRSFQQPLAVQQLQVVVGVSVGAALFPVHHDTPDALLRAADTALYRAKHDGRNRFALYTRELQTQAAMRFSTEQQLRRAIESGELVLLYQPELDTGTMQISLVEALLRWRKPDGELVSPDSFLAVAEESGLIAEIGDWVLGEALAAVARWRHGDAWPEARVAINVSSRQLFDLHMPQRLQKLLDHNRLPPDAVEIELTETVLQTGLTTVTALHRLREIGVAVALDDFGSGYSGLASLDQLPITRVKLDRSLVAEVDSSPKSAAIMSATVQLCADLGLQVTAEGVERVTQLAALLRHRPVVIQGYLVSRPLSETEIPAFVSQMPDRAESLLLGAGLGRGAESVIQLFPSARQRSK
jgi:diguanylate cyclase (GGDEF)-like protein